MPSACNLITILVTISSL